MIHELKTEHKYFQAVADGVKLFEIRRNDRGFGVGDKLRLLEYDRQQEQYSGRVLYCDVTWMMGDAPYVPDGYVCMSIKISKGPVHNEGFKRGVLEAKR